MSFSPFTISASCRSSVSRPRVCNCSFIHRLTCEPGSKSSPHCVRPLGVAQDDMRLGTFVLLRRGQSSWTLTSSNLGGGCPRLISIHAIPAEAVQHLPRLRRVCIAHP